VLLSAAECQSSFHPVFIGRAPRLSSQEVLARESWTQAWSSRAAAVAGSSKFWRWPRVCTEPLACCQAPLSGGPWLRQQPLCRAGGAFCAKIVIGTAARLRLMLKDVVDEGTGKAAQVVTKLRGGR